MYTVALVLACLSSTVYSQNAQTIEPAHDANSKHLLASLLFAKSSVANSRVKLARASANPSMATSSSPIADWAGVTAPLGFFDPVGFSSDISEGRQRFYREVELKHGRLAMLAALGILVAEQFHPLFGGEIDVPAVEAFRETLQLEAQLDPSVIYLAILISIFIPEVFSVFTFNSPAGGEPWSIREDHAPGNLGFDPLGLKPTDEEELKVMQTKELNNGRLAMLGAAGMIAQEYVKPDKIFDNLVDPLQGTR
mmetsp:Transcript_79666/g.125633  ORF Transcript_79666/g.125633 Transcript_79666/m.125633 type:complete len:252 (-) Transcript_79666:297-1052(-)